MKKLFLIGLLAAFSVSCVHHQGYHTRTERPVHISERSDWGYDRNYRVVRGGNERRIESFQRQSLRKIEQGRKRGHLSRNGYNRLMRRYHQIEVKENRFMRNGRLSSSEVRQLERDLVNLDRMISQEVRSPQRGSRRF